MKSNFCCEDKKKTKRKADIVLGQLIKQYKNLVWDCSVDISLVVR